MTPQEFTNSIRQEVGRAIVGQDRVVTQLVTCFLAEGHILLEGVPGVAKTLLAKTMAAALGLQFKRIQFTPDLMPTDITGTNVFDMKTSQFNLRKGPVFTDFLLADEVNRTPPKTQAALLEAMEERCVTIDGDTHRLPEYFFVAATQNPIEYEGTYPLPEAQLDRFMMKVLIDYPAEEEELGILQRSHEGFDPHRIHDAGVRQICDPVDIDAVREQCQKVTVQDTVLNYLSQIIRTTRQSPLLALGASPRAGIALLASAKACAAMEGRDYLLPDDIKEYAIPVLRHRLILKPESLIEDLTSDAVIEQVLSDIPVPR